ncbi:hypothetical protein C8J55DRAFT_499115 [Lentinula edodes]|uniref:Secreted protein n=1 Tax=Lentinula lateritia TaxID=40482 RepID=A0A9W9B0B3_9AGAR|nr:hypothetical protein C8J55DRAFT_499115 [Lentinula edodes]
MPRSIRFNFCQFLSFLLVVAGRSLDQCLEPNVLYIRTYAATAAPWHPIEVSYAPMNSHFAVDFSRPQTLQEK